MQRVEQSRLLEHTCTVTGSFRRGNRMCAGRRCGAVLEVGPGAVLAGMVGECWEHTSTSTDRPVVVVPGLRERREVAGLLSGVGELFVRGVAVDWSAVVGKAAQLVDLPTYAFQHERFWLEPAAGAVGDVESAGLVSVDHPVLSAAVSLPGGRGMVLTGRVSVRTHPWLAECVIAGMVILPTSAIMDMVIRAGDEAGCPVVAELVIDSPVVVGDGVAIQMMVEACGEDGRHHVQLYSHTGDEDREAWTYHARATLAPPRKPAEWPPVTVESTTTKVTLDQDTAGFGIHPALVEAALAGQCTDTNEIMLPLVWKDVVLHASGAQALRVHITPTGPATVSLLACDDNNQPVLSVGSLEFRAMPEEHLNATPCVGGWLFGVEWVRSEVGGVGGVEVELREVE